MAVKAVFHENFALDSKKGKAAAYMYDQLWETIEFYLKKMEVEHKDKMRKLENARELKATRKTLQE